MGAERPERDGLLAALTDQDVPLVVRLDREPHPATRRLMDFLGVEIVVVDPVRQAPGGAVTDTDGQAARGARTMGDFHPVSTGRVSPEEMAAVPSREELRRRNQERLDAQPLTVRCGLDGCGWRFDGPAGEARERARQHRADRHGITGTGRAKTHAEEHAEGEAAAALRRQRLALEALDAGEPQQPTGEVAAPVLRRAVDGATPGDASGEGNEPDTGAAAPPRGGSWTREQVVAAIQRWAREHGGRPPTQADWLRRGEWWPTFSIAAKTFGGWGAALAAAGFTATARGRPRGSRVADSTSRSPSLATPDETPVASDRHADSPPRPDAADPLSVAGLTLDEIQACGQIMAAAVEAVRPLPAASRKRVAGLVAAIFHYSKAA